MQTFLSRLKQEAIAFVDFRFTDFHSVWHHIAFPTSMVDEDLLTEGIFFDGSSIPGWSAINESDMLLRPDFASARVDPFAAHPTLAVICDVWDPHSQKPYDRDPRSIAKKAQEYLISSGIADQAYFGPEAEFFIFDQIAMTNQPHHSGYQITSGEFISNTDLCDGHRPDRKGAYLPVGPVDRDEALRAQMCVYMKQMGVVVEKHHHEVAPGQHEIGVLRSTLVSSADEIQIYQYVACQAASRAGKTATFMPKPLFGDNGSGLHVHQSLWKDGQPLFAGDQYAGLSEMALYYVGGVLHHAKSLNAITNPSTNSYRRLIPGFEAPVICAYSAQNRSASCRIPTGKSLGSKRVEIRFPDPLANPYLAFSAMLLAGLDGIKNKIHPGEACSEDLYHDKAAAARYPTLCGSLDEALKSLEKDHEYLTAGGVFSERCLESYLDLKWQEVKTMAQRPHPWEFHAYYNR